MQVTELENALDSLQVDEFRESLRVDNPSAYAAALYNVKMAEIKKSYFSIRTFQHKTRGLVAQLQRERADGLCIESIKAHLAEARDQLCMEFQRNHVDVDEDNVNGGLWVRKLSSKNGWTRPKMIPVTGPLGARYEKTVFPEIAYRKGKPYIK